MFQIALKVKFGTSLISLTKLYLQRTNSLKSESCLKFQNEKASHQKENSLSEQISLARLTGPDDWALPFLLMLAGLSMQF